MATTWGKSFRERFCKNSSLHVSRNITASNMGNGRVISLLWQLQCHYIPDHDKFSSLSNITVVAIFPNVCLWRRSYAQNWEVLALKNCYSIEPPSYASAAYVVASYDPRFFSTVRFVKIRETCENFLGKWFTASPGKKFPVRLCKREIQKATIPMYYKHNKSHTCKFICLTLYFTRYLQVVF